MKEAIEHFEKALEFSHGTNPAVLSSLAHIHRQVGDNDKALDYLKKFLDCSPSPYYMVQGLSQAQLIYQAKANGRKDSRGKKIFQELGERVVKTSLNLQCRNLLQQGRCPSRLQAEVWVSLVSLLRFLSASPPVRQTPQSSSEIRLLDSLKSWLSLPVLKEMKTYTTSQASDGDFLLATVTDLFHYGRYDDVTLFLSLLQLTETGRVTSSWPDVDLYARSCVYVAGEMLQLCPVTADPFEVGLAKIFFTQAFVDVVDRRRKAAAGIPDGRQAAEEDQTASVCQVRGGVGGGGGSLHLWFCLFSCLFVWGGGGKKGLLFVLLFFFFFFFGGGGGSILSLSTCLSVYVCLGVCV